MSKFHINKNGVPALCKAKTRDCPLGIKEHFNTIQEAQLYSEKMFKKEYGILPKSKETCYRTAVLEKDRKYIEKQKVILRNESDNDTYIERCRSSIRLKDFKPAETSTIHYERDRKDKNDGLIKNFGEGNLVGHYEVDHLMVKYGKYKKQIMEIRDNGRLIVYDKHTNREVTTFMVHRARAEATMILAGDIPDNRFLGRLVNNRAKSEKLNLG